ncbi:hypothetical protein [Ciceribacter ferrooxidans]|uniref:Intracellular growth attenuator family protein n=1 Tax=Ciceribacter ferrooxidans TaxID=2509717 RepID=A0A4Q2S6N9_9HYPH|nr:hypothetical protein [Ciceribacter ferrooxidans]RYB97991.1 hypothetical protein EUU22_23160 [Ciceribacter ferrooxidans]
MAEGDKETRSSAIAAFVILLGVALALLVMPKVVLWVGGYSPVLAAALGTLVILAFFLIFWLRARYQRRRGDQD